MIDLHTHSTASDGTYSPSELVRLAKKEGLKALALTDHDTLLGLKEAFETSREEKLDFLCGVEISIKCDGPGHFHLLGYFLTPEIPFLETTLLSLQKARDKRNELMLEKLKALGIDITMDELKEIAQGEIGRPHFAQLLVQKGVVKTFQEAFDRYLKKGASAYVPKALLTPEEGINKIYQSGGIPVLAHPITLRLNEKELSNYLSKLKEMGIQGIEVYYSEHSKALTEFLYTEAKRLDLLITGGSDFHGTNKPDIKLGRGFGNLKIPYDLFLKLKKALEKNSS